MTESGFDKGMNGPATPVACGARNSTRSIGLLLGDLAGGLTL
jgi:hypothetical protein